MPNAIIPHFLCGSWLDQQFKTGTIKIISTHKGLEEIKNEDVKHQLAIIKSPRFWTGVYNKNSWTNSTKMEMTHITDDDLRDFSELFMQQDEKFGHLYIKRMQNTTKIPTRSTEGAARYDLSTAEETVVPAKGKLVVKTGLSMAVPDGYYGCIAPRSGLAAKKTF